MKIKKTSVGWGIIGKWGMVTIDPIRSTFISNHKSVQLIPDFAIVNHQNNNGSWGHTLISLFIIHFCIRWVISNKQFGEWSFVNNLQFNIAIGNSYNSKTNSIESNTFHIQYQFFNRFTTCVILYRFKNNLVTKL